MSNIFLLGGDWRYFWPENIGYFVHLPSAWDSILNTGLGQPAIGTLWITSYLNFTSFFSILGLSWSAIGFIFWILPAVLFSFFGAKYLFNTFFPAEIRWGFLAGFIYLFNSYFLMIFSGGQMGVVLAYSITPIVISRFIYNVNKPNLKNGIIFGLLFALQLLFDPRLVYITLFPIFIYFLIYIGKFRLSKKNTWFIIVIPSLITLMLHVYWLIPILFTYSANTFNSTSIGGVDFFSFAKFENSISLLHPNWPENIFGKIYFMRPEFLLLPVIAYAGILFSGKNKTSLIFLSLLGLVGSFLAKGTNDPFGTIYLFLFNNFPGFLLFRDPTKWYLLIALSYSILIPYTILNIYIKLKSDVKFQISSASRRIKFQNILLIFTILYLIFLIRIFFVSNNLTLTRSIPNDYILLKDKLVSDKEFSRTFWIPKWQRYGYFSNLHPAIGREEISKSSNINSIIEMLNKPVTEQLFGEMSIRYVVIPYDSEGEIFLKDRKYNKDLYEVTKKQLDKIPWLKRLKGYNMMAVYETSLHYDHFWILPGNQLNNKTIRYEEVSPTLYKLKLRNINKGDKLIFSESFNNGWIVKVDNNKIISSPYKNTLNIFTLPKKGSYNIEVYYYPQRLVDIGLLISMVTLYVSLFLIISFNRNNR